MPPGEHQRRSASAARGGSPSDCALLRQTRDGLGEAFTLLYQRYASRLRAVVWSQTSRALAPRFDPEDVVQDVFSALFFEAAAGRCNIPEGQDAWALLVVVALNRVRALANWHRAARRDVRRTLGGNLSERLVRSLAAPEEWPLVELWLLTGEILDQLPPAQRRVVELRIGGDDVGTIAAKVRRSTRTVERFLHQFRRRLRASCHAADKRGGCRGGARE
jgi:DNA-directed RNA polymerase specialized sigma24 family protein